MRLSEAERPADAEVSTFSSIASRARMSTGQSTMPEDDRLLGALAAQTRAGHDVAELGVQGVARKRPASTCTRAIRGGR